ncbi:amidase family protein, partial [Staphylococcus capitis]|uniref:amidase family protein n=1 Tax=Staphylococcus capitis TaxID=29388 RepID=UPI00370975DC
KQPQSLQHLYKISRSQGFPTQVKPPIFLPTFPLTSAYYHPYYKNSQKLTTLIKNHFHKLFQQYHLLLPPTPPT